MMSQKQKMPNNLYNNWVEIFLVTLSLWKCYIFNYYVAFYYQVIFEKCLSFLKTPGGNIYSVDIAKQNKAQKWILYNDCCQKEEWNATPVMNMSLTCQLIEWQV